MVDQTETSTLHICNIYSATIINKKMKSHGLLFGVDSKKKINDFYVNKCIKPGKFKLEPVSVDDVY